MNERRRRLELRLVACAVLASTLHACRVSPSDDKLEPSYTPIWLISGETRYLGLAPGGRLLVVDLATGQRVWDFELSKEPNPFGARHQGLVCTPAVIGRSIVVREEEELVVLDVATGTATYREAAEPAARFGSAVCPTKLDDESYVATGSGGRLLRRARPDGAEVWSVELPDEEIAVGPARRLAGGAIAVRTKNRLILWSWDGRLQRSEPLSEYDE